MSYTYMEIVTCRVAIQVCIGYLANGRERHRTFSMKGIRPDAPLERIAAVVRALAPVLAYPITKVRKVVTRRFVFTGTPAAQPPYAIALPLPAETAAGALAASGKRTPAETGKFPVVPFISFVTQSVEREAERRAAAFLLMLMYAIYVQNVRALYARAAYQACQAGQTHQKRYRGPPCYN